MAWLCHPSHHPSSPNDGSQTHHCIGNAGAPHPEHGHDSKGDGEGTGPTAVGHSSVPFDEEPHATILGLEDGGHLVGASTKTVCLLSLLMKELFTIAYPLLAQVPLVGLHRC